MEDTSDKYIIVWTSDYVLYVSKVSRLARPNFLNLHALGEKSLA